MCLICKKDTQVRLKGDYLECQFCKTWIAKILPDEKPVQEVLEAHAQEYILGNQEAFDMRTYSARLEVIKKYVKDAKTVLDFGCGNGNFVKFLNTKGYKAFGYDKSEAITKHLASQVMPLYRTEKEIPNAYFDLITCFDVIEHTTNPVEIVETFRKKLKKGGILFITTPNAEGISAKILSKHWWVFGSEAHFVVFSPFSLELLFKRHQFKTLEVSTDTLTPWVTPSDKLLSRMLNKIIYLIFLSFCTRIFAKGLGDNIQMIVRG